MTQTQIRQHRRIFQVLSSLLISQKSLEEKRHVCYTNFGTIKTHRSDPSSLEEHKCFNQLPGQKNRTSHRRQVTKLLALSLVDGKKQPLEGWGRNKDDGLSYISTEVTYVHIQHRDREDGATGVKTTVPAHSCHLHISRGEIKYCWKQCGTSGKTITPKPIHFSFVFVHVHIMSLTCHLNITVATVWSAASLPVKPLFSQKRIQKPDNSCFFLKLMRTANLRDIQNCWKLKPLSLLIWYWA